MLCKSGGMKSASHKPIANALPAPAWFVVSALFHYLGPAFAVLLFARVAPLGVAWLRIATSAILLAAWRRPWRTCEGRMRTRAARSPGSAWRSVA